MATRHSRQTNADLIAKLQRERRVGCAPNVDFPVRYAVNLAECGWGTNPEVLRIASDPGRILVSQDRRTMPAHFARYSASAQSSGVILLREAISISTTIEELVLVWSASEAEEWIGRLVWIPL